MTKITVTDDDDELEGAHYVVCVRASTPAKFPDDVYNFCCKCGEKVRERPYNPVAPKRVCIECLPLTLDPGQNTLTSENVLTSKKQLAEVTEVLKKDKQ